MNESVSLDAVRRLTPDLGSAQAGRDCCGLSHLWFNWLISNKGGNDPSQPLKGRLEERRSGMWAHAFLCTLESFEIAFFELPTFSSLTINTTQIYIQADLERCISKTHLHTLTCARTIVRHKSRAGHWTTRLGCEGRRVTIEPPQACA
jgi:hypothetical protein